MTKVSILSLAVCAAIILLARQHVEACGCGGSSKESPEAYVTRMLNEAHVVFAGTVTGFQFKKGIDNPLASLEGTLSRNDYETRVAVFAVSRWWKGSPAKRFEVATQARRFSDGMTTNSSCDYNFEKGKSYLVFAFREGNAVRTHSCAGNRPLDGAQGVIQILGEGEIPHEDSTKPTDGSLLEHFLSPLR